MHRTLAADATRPPSLSPALQAQRFAQWTHTFNERRPHEALGGATPASRSTPSPRPLPRRLPPLEYPLSAELRRVTTHGSIKWQNTAIFLSHVLRGEYVALHATADEEWTITFGPLTLGVYSRALLAFTEQLAWTPALT